MHDNGCASNEDRCKYDDIVKYMTLTEVKTKIGCTRYDLCSAGITVTNQSGGSLYYRLNGGACTTWTNSDEYLIDNDKFLSGVHRCCLRHCLCAAKQYELLPAEGS